MGAPNLWKTVESARTACNLRHFLLEESLKLQRRGLSPYTIGVDASLVLMSCKAIGSNPAVKHLSPEKVLLFKLCRMLYLPANFVFVFDGPHKPAQKRSRAVKNIDTWARVRPLIQAFGYSSLTAPGEAEAELAAMNRKGVIDAVWTDDGDALIFGALTVIRWPSTTSDDAYVYQASDIETAGMSQNKLILYALLCGHDYGEEGLPGCGKTLAVYAARSAKLADRLVETFETISQPAALDGALAEWKDDVRRFLLSKGRKHAVAQWPVDYPSFTVLTQLIHPETSWSVNSGRQVPRRPLHLPPSLHRLRSAHEALFGESPEEVLKFFKNNIFGPYAFSFMFSPSTNYSAEQTRFRAPFGSLSLASIQRRVTRLLQDHPRSDARFSIHQIYLEGGSFLQEGGFGASTPTSAPSSVSVWMPYLFLRTFRLGDQYLKAPRVADLGQLAVAPNNEADITGDGTRDNPIML